MNQVAAAITTAKEKFVDHTDAKAVVTNATTTLNTSKDKWTDASFKRSQS